MVKKQLKYYNCW